MSVRSTRLTSPYSASPTSAATTIAAQALGIFATWMLFDRVTPRPRWALKNSATIAPIMDKVVPTFNAVNT